MNPKFSIIIPTYNRVNELVRCIDSIVATNVKSYEIIIVDDGSTDNTEAIIDNKNYPNLYYIKTLNSGAPAAPRNIGLKKAIGDYILFVDSDDEFYGDRLEFLNKKVNSKYDIYYHDIRLYHNGVFQKVLKSNKLDNDVFIRLVRKGNIVFTSTICIKKSKIGNETFNENKSFKSVEDYEFWLRLAKKNLKFHYLKGAYVNYHHDLDSISRVPENTKNILNLVRLYKCQLDKKSYKIMKVRAFYYVASTYFATKKYKDADRIFKLLVLMSMNVFLIPITIKCLIRHIHILFNHKYV